MSCNSCHKNPCCCEKLISVRGKKGAKGDKGIAGPQGNPGQDAITKAFIFTNPDTYTYPALETPLYQITDTFTVTEAGNYLILFEGSIQYNDIALQEIDNFSVEYALFKNTVIVTNSERESREIWTTYEGATPIVCATLNSGILSLSVGDVIDVQFKTNISGVTFNLLKRSLTLIKINNLTIL